MFHCPTMSSHPNLTSDQILALFLHILSMIASAYSFLFRLTHSNFLTLFTNVTAIISVYMHEHAYHTVHTGKSVRSVLSSHVWRLRSCHWACHGEQFTQ